MSSLSSSGSSTSHQFHAPPHVIETEIELFLDNFKYVTSLLNSEFSVFDCGNQHHHQHQHHHQLNCNATAAAVAGAVYRGTNRVAAEDNRLSWPESHDSWTTTSISGPKRSVTSPSDNNRNSIASSSMLSTDVTSFEFEMDPPSSSNVLQHFTDVCTTDNANTDNNMPSNLTVIDVVDALQANYAFISGGRSRCFCHIITFPECTVAQKVAEDQYRSLVTYLTSIPPLHDADLGFVIVVDRRRNRWASVKTLLLRISHFFPALIQKICVLRPASFLQKAFADVALKFLADDFKAKILMLNSAEDLNEYIDKDQLTVDLGGHLAYDHREWIQHRAALEKFSGSASDIAGKLRQLCGKLQDIQFPNDVRQTEDLMSQHNAALFEVRQELDTVIDHGETLLVCFKTVRASPSTDDDRHNGFGQDMVVSTSQLPLSRAGHVTAVERLLVQLDETSSNFETFWTNHKRRLEQCLQLRHFEEQFKQIHFAIDQHMTTLNYMVDKSGDSVEETSVLTNELRQFEMNTKADIDRADELRVRGEEFIDSSHYAEDCIRPKCLELHRISNNYKDVLEARFNHLEKLLLVHKQIDKVSSKVDSSAGEPSSFSASACDKQMLVIRELIETERIYCTEMGSIVQGYLRQLENLDLQHLIDESLRQKKHVLFGNLDQIYTFHAKIFLRDLEESNNQPSLLGSCFVQRSIEFQMYGLYCQNMKESELLLQQLGDSNAFLQECQRRLEHRLPLGAYLLKPVQRITKYQLLLKELLRHCEDDDGYNNVKKALATMTSVVKYVNDAMHQNSIKGFNGNFLELGELLVQGAFNVWIEHRWEKIRDLRFKPMARHVFLYKNAVLFCKEKETPSNGCSSTYIFKNALKTADVGLTESIKGDKKKFELWSPGRTDVYILQASSVEQKEIWLSEIKRVLQNQFNELRNHQQVDQTVRREYKTATFSNPAHLLNSESFANSDMSLVTESNEYLTSSAQYTEAECHLRAMTSSSHQLSMKRSETEPVQSLPAYPVMKRSITELVTSSTNENEAVSNSSTLDAIM